MKTVSAMSSQLFPSYLKWFVAAIPHRKAGLEKILNTPVFKETFLELGRV